MVSSAQQVAPDARDDKTKGVGRRLLSRMKTVFKKTEPSRRPSTLPAPPPPTTTAPLRPSTIAGPPVEQPAPATKQPSQPAPQESQNLGPDDDELPPGVEKVARAKIYGDRAQHLSERYGLELDPYACYQMDGHVLRMHKTTQIRIHRQCHQCGNQLSRGGQCDKCSHRICRQCPRYPPKRTEPELSASRDHRAQILKERSANATITPDWKADASVPVVIRRPAKAPVQQELVYKKIRQRVRRTCCQCLEAGGAEVLFQSGGKFCSKCNHTRCTDCPRDPPKKGKYPYGYPGDAFGPKSIPHYKCHECYAKFPVGVEDGTACLRCSHEKCDNCKRLLPQKVEPEPDPEVLKSVQEKLAAMQLR